MIGFARDMGSKKRFHFVLMEVTDGLGKGIFEG